jgi:hypothetical protein
MVKERGGCIVEGEAWNGVRKQGKATDLPPDINLNVETCFQTSVS